MENIYTIKVRSNPDPRSLYPSERRYSASTVLGLSVFHLALAITVLLLASLNLGNTNLKKINYNNNEIDLQNLNSAKSNDGQDGVPVTSHQDGSSDVTVTSQNPQDGGKIQNINESNFKNKSDEVLKSDDRNSDMAFLDDEISDSVIDNVIYEELRYNQFVSLTLIPSIMSLGAIAAGLTGLLAWKKWYVDYNIRWFFFMSLLSVITSLICITMACLTVGTILEQRSVTTANMFIFTFNHHNVMINKLEQNDPNSLQSKILSKPNQKTPNLRLVLAINILIASFLELTWSILSTKVAYLGMKNSYPDDMILSRGKIEVSTVSKGNKVTKAVAPDILNHHPKKRKFVKYFPKNDNGLLPKQESNVEYRDRVNKFLNGSDGSVQ